MFVDANSVDDGTRIDAEICVVGAGAAGISLARALARHGVDSALLESGGFEPEPATQSLYDVTNLRPEFPMSNNDQLGGDFAKLRLRYFGGTTNVWGGMCRPLDEEDFLPRPWVAASGWPIRRADLDPYYLEAMSILDIPRRWHGIEFGQLAEDADREPYLLGPQHPEFEPLVWLQSSPVTRMSRKYRDEIAHSASIRCFLQANATELVPDESASRVVELRVRTLAGRRLTCRAKHYALCAGGIENARLLLLSDSVVPGGLGNQYDLVGRYLMEHPSTAPLPSLLVLSPGGRGHFQEEDVCRRSRAGGLPGIKSELFGFKTTAALCRDERLLACAIDAFGDPRSGNDSMTAAIGHLMVATGGNTLPAPPVRVYDLFVLSEQSPNPESRIYLGTDRDALGQRRTVIDFKLRDQDAQSIRTSLERFARAIGASGNGRVRLWTREQTITASGSHDMGMTRMADDPRHGVTDRYGRVHGIENLFIAGGSLFPTSGFANPTLTIVALALRLAERLKNVDRAGARPSIGIT